MHIFHVSTGIVCLILLLFFTFLLSLLYFDGIHNDNKVNSRSNSRGIFALILYETVLVVFYNFLNGGNYNGILIFVYLAGSILTFYLLHMNSPFNEQIISKVWSFLSTINIWTAIMFTMAQLTEKRIFHGIIYAWAIGLPLLFLIILMSPADKNKVKYQTNKPT